MASVDYLSKKVMRTFAKKVVYGLPRPLRRLILSGYERAYAHRTLSELRKTGVEIKNVHPGRSGGKTKILFYHVSGLAFGGTEKSLQIIAKYLDPEKYEVYYMYSPKPRSSTGNIPLDGRKGYLANSAINLIEFDYRSIDGSYPYIVRDMKPSVFDVIDTHKPDLIITAGSGYSEFPFNVIRDIPIILVNIFGSPSVQSNIEKHVCISHVVADKIKLFVPNEKNEVMYIQSEPPLDTTAENRALRESLGIKETDTVFGRIGRADDSIFDPIGINAFERVVRDHPDAHYIIMSPPPILRKMVADRAIPNVHFLAPSGAERDVWTFHRAIDVLAHFRLDGESFGLNIAESMLVGNPIITHRSHIWNAQLEYLEPTFSRVADRGDVTAYTDFMKQMIQAKADGSITAMRAAAKQKAEALFLMRNNIARFEGWISDILAK